MHTTHTCHTEFLPFLFHCVPNLINSDDVDDVTIVGLRSPREKDPPVSGKHLLLLSVVRQQQGVDR